MANLAEAFEEHLRSLNDDEWTALTSRVRQQSPAPAPRPLPNEQDAGETRKNPGFDEAVRRGYIDKSGKPIGKARP